MDRAYIVKINGRYEEVKMAVLVVNCLLCLNKNEHRANANFDKAFIKTLVIALHTLKRIKIGEPIHKDLLVFIRGNFFTIFNLNLSVNFVLIFVFVRTISHSNLWIGRRRKTLSFIQYIGERGIRRSTQIQLHMLITHTIPYIKSRTQNVSQYFHFIRYYFSLF